MPRTCHRRKSSGLTVLEVTLSGVLAASLALSLVLVSRKRAQAAARAECAGRQAAWGRNVDQLESDLHRWEVSAPECLRVGFVPVEDALGDHETTLLGVGHALNTGKEKSLDSVVGKDVLICEAYGYHRGRLMKADRLGPGAWKLRLAQPQGLKELRLTKPTVVASVERILSKPIPTAGSPAPDNAMKPVRLAGAPDPSVQGIRIDFTYKDESCTYETPTYLFGSVTGAPAPRWAINGKDLVSVPW